MKLDLIVYGRGQERLEGYQLFAAPSYWSDEMLLKTGAFNELWTQGDLSGKEPEVYRFDKNPWGNTYMFFAQKSPCCCAFLRCTRVEGDEPGTWLKEARNRDIWSMEGVCCPFENREEFFAMLPSVILWLEHNNTSFYRRLKDGTIGKSVEIPDEFFYNPYDIINREPPESLDRIFSNSYAIDHWLELCRMISYAKAPFPFFFGPLSDYFKKNAGANYGIETVFSTINGVQNDSGQIKDPFDSIELISEKKVDVKLDPCELCIKFGYDKESNIAHKFILNKLNDPEQKTVVESDFINPRSGFSTDLLTLEAEAECVRDFSRSAGWNVNDAHDDITARYRIEVEE